jgi:hypothetical protein
VRGDFFDIILGEALFRGEFGTRNGGKRSLKHKSIHDIIYKRYYLSRREKSLPS